MIWSNNYAGERWLCGANGPLAPWAPEMHPKQGRGNGEEGQVEPEGVVDREADHLLQGWPLGGNGAEESEEVMHGDARRATMHR